MPEIAAASPALTDPAASAATCASICVKSAPWTAPADSSLTAPPVRGPAEPTGARALSMRSSLQEIEGHVDEFARLPDRLQVRLIGAVGLAQVSQFHQHVHVRELDVTLLVRRRMAGVEFDAERLLVHVDAAHAQERRARRPAHLVLERDD